MKYFNSVTGKFEDDGLPEETFSTVKIPSGRALKPDGSLDIEVPLEYAARELQAYKNYRNADLSNVPDLTGTAGLLDSASMPASSASASMPALNSNASNASNAYQPQMPQASNANSSVNAYQASNAQSPNQKRASASVPNQTEIVNEYLKNKYFSPLEKYSEAEREKLDKTAKDKKNNLKWYELLANAADVYAGKRADSSAFDNIRAQIDANTTGKFDKQKAQAIADMKQSADLEKMNPDSNASKSFRNLVSSTMPNIAKAFGADFNKITAADADKILDFGRMRENIEARKQEAKLREMDRREMMQLRKAEMADKHSPENRVKSLNSGDKARLDNALMALKALDDMGTALDNGQNTFSVIGDNDYTANERRATEAYGRMQSGGAINREEEKRFSKTLPQTTDSKEMQRKKIETQKNEMISRLRTLGFTPEQLGYETRSFNYGKSEQKKPKTVIQNGHTYILNESTGEYE